MNENCAAFLTTDILPENISPVHQASSNLLAIESSNEPEQFTDFDIGQFQKVLHHEALLLLSELYNAASVPRYPVQLVFDSAQSFMNEGISLLRAKVINRLKMFGENDDTLTEISGMFEILQHPFRRLETEYQRFRELENPGDLIHAHDYTLCDRYQKNLPKD